MADGGWYADDAFWEAFYPVMFAEAGFAAAEAQVGALLGLAGEPRGAVLDLACGAGRHSIPLARRGLAVTGVDRSAFLLRKARERGRDAGVEVEWIEADMAEFTRPGAFALALNLATSFGYFPTEAENQRVLENVHASLAPGGVFVMELTAKEVLARIYQPERSRDLPGATVVQRQEVVEAWSQIANEWTVAEGDRVRRFRFQHWVYSARELAQMLRAAGFGGIRLCGDFSGVAYGPASSRLVVLARGDAAA